ncbi:PH domain-containing protein [Streptomyces sp. NPDC001002]
MRRGRMLAFLGVILVGMLTVPLPMLADDGLSASVAVPVAIAWVALMGWLFYAALRCSTTADIKAIHARGMLRRRRLAWEDVQDIRAEPTYGDSGSASVVVYVYGRDGRRVLLPFVDDQHVHVERELTVLTEAWHELRGADWSPDLEAAVLIGRRDVRRQALWLGFGCAMLAVIPLTVLMLLPLFVDVPGWLESTLDPLVVMGLGVPLVFALTAIAAYRSRLSDS